MDRLARDVVQLEYAFAARAANEEEHGRLALILFDSLAELLMHRECEWLLQMDGWKRRQIDQVDLMIEQGHDLPESLKASIDALRSQTLSKRAQQNVRRNFDAKADYLVAKATLDVRIARVLRKLHQYRNEIYHRDEVRSDSLNSVVTVYALVACDLLTRLTPHSFSHPVPTALVPYLDDNSYPSFDLPERIATHFRADAGLGNARALPEAFAELVRQRREELLESLDFCLSMFPDGWTRDDLLRMVQGPRVPLELEDIRKLTVPFDLADVYTWTSEADQIAAISDPLDAFGAFADFEDRYEPLENAVTSLAHAVDDEIQLQIDIARGK